ncbi:histone acetyltransferase MCC1-like isoform X2 [Apium graveolens]
MFEHRRSHRPSISYRPIRPSDLEVIEKIHAELFPIRYESEFFLNVVNGRDIVSWGAVDRNRHNGKSDELIGFVTARINMARESEVEDLLRFERPQVDETLVYILTLGVVDSYRNHGIATSLIREVIKYASNIPTCQAVYLHVISYNNSAIHLYNKMSFQCVRRLHAFYFINGQHYDSYLFIYYVNGGRSPCSPLELATLLVAYVRSGFRLAASRLWWKKGTEVPRWMKCKESSSCLIPMTQNKRMLTTTATGCQFA